ncbi:hypothetical protein ACFRQM_09580 [Streptomyces sp. NPDC056831]|uniref:hypothetical protein n=1 Tax=Streptomyces sp. NPDC056831 TaxID=3345954 RepID=UPI0036ABF6D7
MIGPAALVPLVEDLVRYAVYGDVDQAAHVLDRVAEHGDAADMYGLCVAVAESGRDALLALPTAPDLFLGDVLGLDADTARPDPHRLFAARFLTAYLHDDREITTALYCAAHTAGDPARTESVCALLAQVSGLHRRATFTTTSPEWT